MADTLFPDLMKTIASARLFFRDGSSDKEYHAAIHEKERDDLESADCVLSQLKYKPSGDSLETDAG